MKPFGHLGDLPVTFFTALPLTQEIVFLEPGFTTLFGVATTVGVGVGVAEADVVGVGFGCEIATSIVGLEKVKFLAEMKSQPSRSPEAVVEMFCSLSP